MLSWIWVPAFLLAAQAPSPQVTFRQVPPSESGITWVHTNARSEHRYLPETIPPGVAIFDYNSDGLMDILLVNTGESAFFHPAKPLRPALYRNNGNGTFTDVTEKAGLTANFFGMGVAVADYDGDGYADVFLPVAVGRFCITTMATALSPMSPRGAGLMRRDGLQARFGSTTTTTGSWIFSWFSSWIIPA